jgi:gamma-glutamyl-gamma-aminobutyrate hydrolase PuuD
VTRRRRLLVRAGAALGLALAGAGGFEAWARWGRGPRAPVIGISVSRDWYDVARLNPAPYAAALGRAGANVLLLASGDAAALDGVDGLLLVGGGDVGADREHDAFERALLRRAEARGIPVLGICRGAQVIAAAHGGTLGPLEGESARRHGVTLQSLSAHDVRCRPGSILHGALGGGARRVSSTHVQAIVDPGPRLRVAAEAEDGVIEAVELPGPRFVVGIQWHPEIGSLAEESELSPFRLLVEAAAVRP